MKVTIHSGNCGFKTVVEAEVDAKYQAKVQVESQCPHVTKMTESLGSLNAMNELFKKGQSQIISASNQYLPHVTCPVGIGMLKAIEASAKMALPQNASIEFADESRINR